MNLFSRGIRDAFRNSVRTVGIVVILGLSIGLALSMLIANKAVNQKIESVKSSVGNTVTIAPAGVRGTEGGGSPLTVSQLANVASLAHVSGLSEQLTDRLTTDNTSLQSAIDAGSLGKRFQTESGGGATFFARGDGEMPAFSPPVSALGSTDTGTLDGSTVKLVSGQQIDGSKDLNSALIGKNLADKNNLHAGSTFTAYGTTITVAGIFDTGTTFSNNQVIFALPTLQRLSGQSGDVTSATATVDSLTNVDSVVSAVKSKLGSSADVTSSKDSAEAAVAPLQSIKNISLFSLIGAVAAGGVIILLTMVMIVRERKREIGITKAVGGSNVRIAGQFMTEALTLTVLGAAAGLIIGVAAANPVTNMLASNAASNSQTSMMAKPGLGSGGPSGPVVNFGGPGAGQQGFGRRLGNNHAARGLRTIHAAAGWSVILYGFGAALLIALTGSALAAVMIAKVRPSTVMRSE